MLGGPFAADEEDVPARFEAADESAEGMAVDKVRFVVGAGYLEAIGIGRPAVGFPTEAAETGGGDGGFRCGGEKDGGVEVFNLRAVAEGVDFEAARDLFLFHGEEADLVPVGCAELEGFHFGAKGFSGGQADEAEAAVEAVGMARNDAFEEPVQGPGFVLVGVFVCFQKGCDDGDADGGELLEGEVAGFAVSALDSGEAFGDLFCFRRGSGGAVVDGEDC